MERVDPGPISLEAYRGLIADSLYESVVALGRRLAGLRVVQLNATPRGGGVAEILSSLVPLMRSLGVDCEWYALTPDPAFFEVTKKLHNLLQGQRGGLTPAERRTYLGHAKRTAEEMQEVDADVWIVHDPQPLPIVEFWRWEGPTVWRCHIDTSRPNVGTRRFLMPHLDQYHRLIFTMPEFVFPGLPPEKVRIITPAIDPFAIKNRPLDKESARQTLASLDIDIGRPLMTQVSRLDPWKDPLGVIDAYRLVKERLPELQLALVGAIEAQDDPEAVRVLNEVIEYAAGDLDIHIYWNPNQIGHAEVNAFQTASDVVIQKSIREGFGLTVAEAMWKGTPVIGGRAGGIVAQIEDGVNGFLVDGPAECADRVLRLLRNPALADRIGAAGRETVRERYLMPRLAREELQLLAELTPAVSGAWHIA